MSLSLLHSIISSDSVCLIWGFAIQTLTFYIQVHFGANRPDLMSTKDKCF